MSPGESIRIDKYLWAVRIYKTRSQAADECRKGRVQINNFQVKPSHTVSANQIFTVRKPPVTHTYQVIFPIENRVSAKLAAEYLRDLTPEDEKIKTALARSSGFGIRPKGFGRPTKKERRSIDRLNESTDDFSEVV
jgi:ribosome-associated heat shock protein Hsp15